MTLKSNLRGCSDAFEVRCWSGERVQVAVALDCCAREVIGYVATTAAITGEMIRDLIAEAVEQRFGAGTTQVPHAIEWLSDNGPPYTAHETRFALAGDIDVLAITPIFFVATKLEAFHAGGMATSLQVTISKTS